MKAMLFCAGIGSRLSPITDFTPKPMVEFFGSPLVDYTLSRFEDWGVDEVVVNLSHRPEPLRRHLSAHWSDAFDIRFSVERHLLGTGGGLKKVERLLNGETFLVANSDFLLDPSIDMRQMLEAHFRSSAAATLLLVEDSSGRHTPIQVDANGRISALGCLLGAHDPRRPTYAFCGLQILEPTVFGFLPPDCPSNVIAACVEMLRAGLLAQGFVLDGYWQELGDPSGYLKAHFDLLDGASPFRRVVESDGRFAVIATKDDINMLSEFGVKIGGRVKIEPPVALGKSCVIGDGATVGPYAVVGENAAIGDRATITRSVVWRGATTGPDARRQDAIIYR